MIRVKNLITFGNFDAKCEFLMWEDYLELCG